MDKILRLFHSEEEKSFELAENNSYIFFYTSTIQEPLQKVTYTRTFAIFAIKCKSAK